MTQTRWCTDAVLAAFAAWVWVPEGTTTHPVPGGRALHYPAWVRNRLQLSVAPGVAEVDPAQVLDAVRAVGREVGARTAFVHVADLRGPGGELGPPEPVVAALRRRGAVVEEDLDRLALDMTVGAPPVATRDGLEVRPVLTEEDARGLDRVDAEVFGNPPMTEQRVAEEAREVRDLVESRRGVRAVGWLDGEPVGAGGLTVNDEVAWLWGGATMPQVRRTGVYSAIITRRLALAHEWGATLALVKGRVTTSAPILRGLGFEPYGKEVTWALPV